MKSTSDCNSQKYNRFAGPDAHSNYMNQSETHFPHFSAAISNERFRIWGTTWLDWLYLDISRRRALAPGRLSPVVAADATCPAEIGLPITLYPHESNKVESTI